MNNQVALRPCSYRRCYFCMLFNAVVHIGIISCDFLGKSNQLSPSCHPMLFNGSLNQPSSIPQAVGCTFQQYENCRLRAVFNGEVVSRTLIKGNHVENFSLLFEVFGTHFLVDLYLVKNLFANSYNRKVFHGDTQSSQLFHQPVDHCYYQGQVRGQPTSVAAISSCYGYSGYVSDGVESYHLYPTNGFIGEHRVFRDSDNKDGRFKCGTPDIANRVRMTLHPSSFASQHHNATLVFHRTQDIINIVNSLYRQLNVYVVLVGAEVWSTGDRVTITTDAETTMENFLRYRKERINPFHANDNSQLITGITFEHGVVGKAIKGTMCTHQFSGGVSMDHNGLVSLVATTVAHEMGHNFGMEHDNYTQCQCPKEKCIMASVSGRLSPKDWSSCSQNSLKEAFNIGMDYCLRNLPAAIFSGPVCGDGFVEDGEQCDCGLPEGCNNKCCNATSCQLQSGADCGSGMCCDLDLCQAKGLATECREAIGECDVPEFCDGVSSVCPSDVSVRDGSVCTDGESYCYKANCHSHKDQCQLLWGDTGQVSDHLCFQQLNVRGDQNGNCGYNWTTNHYQRCAREDVMCGLLHCVHLNEKLNFWRDSLALSMRASFLTRGNAQYVCRSAMLDVGLDMPDPGLVPDGARCERDKMCIKQKCTALSKIKTAKCQDCHGNGVCNSKGHCHCFVGYAPPSCGTPGLGGSVDSGPASDVQAKHYALVAILIIFAVIILLGAVIVLAVINRRKLELWWKSGTFLNFRWLRNQFSDHLTPPVAFSAALARPPVPQARPPVPQVRPPVPPARPSVPPARQHLPPAGPSVTPACSSAPPTHPFGQPVHQHHVQIHCQESQIPSGSCSANNHSSNHFNKNSDNNGCPVEHEDHVFLGRLSPITTKKFNVIISESIMSLPSNRPFPARPTGSHFSSNHGDKCLMASSSSHVSTSVTAVAARTFHVPKSTVTAPKQRIVGIADGLKTAISAIVACSSTNKTKLNPQIDQSQSSCSSPRHTDNRSSQCQRVGSKVCQSHCVCHVGQSRSSMHGTSISRPVLLSTTNRDSSVFADFQLDQSGVIARPVKSCPLNRNTQLPYDDVQDESFSIDRCDAACYGNKKDLDCLLEHKGSPKSGSSRELSSSHHNDNPLFRNAQFTSESPFMQGQFSELRDLEAHINKAFDNMQDKNCATFDRTDPEIASKNRICTLNDTPAMNASLVVSPMPHSVTHVTSLTEPVIYMNVVGVGCDVNVCSNSFYKGNTLSCDEEQILPASGEIGISHTETSSCDILISSADLPAPDLIFTNSKIQPASPPEGAESPLTLSKSDLLDERRKYHALSTKDRALLSSIEKKEVLSSVEERVLPSMSAKDVPCVRAHTLKSMSFGRQVANHSLNKPEIKQKPNKLATRPVFKL